jgi:enoyl-CoA hydratase
MSDAYASVRYTVTGKAAWIEFARPPINAFNRRMVEEVRDAIAAAIADPAVHVCVLASANERYFSAGADLAAFRDIGPEGMRSWVGLCHDIARRIRESPKPFLAAIRGTAVGGGLEMTLHCDLRFCATDAKLGQPEVRIGFIPPIATTQVLARMIGRSRAIRYLYDGRTITAGEALEWGLVDELVDPWALRGRVQAYADELAAQSPTALAAIRRTVTVGGGMSFEEGMALELEIATELAATPDFNEGIEAFLAKRKPAWSKP